MHLHLCVSLFEWQKKNWLRPKKTSKIKVIEDAEENFNHPDQMEIKL